MNRREFITMLGGAAAWPLAASAQQPGKSPTVGFLYPGPLAAAPARIAAFLSGLRAGGLRDQGKVELIERITDGDPAKLEPMTADLVNRKVDLIAALSRVAVQAARSATTSIPVVATDLESDPVASGFASSLARPGANITGVFLDFPDFGAKWLELLHEAVPEISVIGVLWDPLFHQTQLKAVEAAAATFNFKLELLEARARSDVEQAFLSAKQREAGALLMLPRPLIGGNTKLFADLALTHRLPALTLFTEFAHDGGLMAYGPNLLGSIRQQGVMAAKILHGANPAELPIERPTKFEFVLNLKAANLLGISVPPSILLRADEVIE
jgi:putative ABC transport system substrate-binding protein